MELSLVVCAYKMGRELPRTIHTLGASNQRSIEGLDYEIIIVDNGSPQPADEAELRHIAPNLRVVRFDPGDPSPVRAINTAMRSAQGDLVGLFIDGARMASPGMVHAALGAHRSDPAKAIGTLAFHLGPDVQMRSVAAGYNQLVEDDLLTTIPWRENGYSLFDISVLAGSSAKGWFGQLNESSGVFLARELWERLGGLDERFQSRGGGLANLDFWKRAVEASDDMPWMLLGEGTFHQVHGGAATNGTDADRAPMLAEYCRITGGPFAEPVYRPRLFGALSDELRHKFGGAPAEHPRHVRSVRGRTFEVGLPPNLLTAIQSGTLRTRYKGRWLPKSPFDLVLYLQLIERAKPRAIVEIGTAEGGSAAWFRDQCDALGLDTQILTVDIAARAPPIENVGFFQGDSTRPAETFPHAQIAALPHPWLVIEDSAHTYPSVAATLSYFDAFLQPGDHIVVEDGVVADLPGPQYRQYQDGPNRAVAEFLTTRGPDRYVIDEDLCDFYGRNVTYSPNAWMKRI